MSITSTIFCHEWHSWVTVFNWEHRGCPETKLARKVQVSSVCRCAGATAPHASIAACTVSGVIYLCQPSQMCSRSVKHELGHVFGVAKHSLDNRDLLYAIPAVEGFSDADKRAICKTGYVSGGVCD